jgi:hypothetical protein
LRAVRIGLSFKLLEYFRGAKVSGPATFPGSDSGMKVAAQVGLWMVHNLVNHYVFLIS